MKPLSVAAAAALILGLSSSGTAGPQEFGRGDLLLSPLFGLNAYAVPFGLSVEYGVTPTAGVGGTVMFWFWGDMYWTNAVIALSADGAYHFTKLDARNLDVFAGASLGFIHYSRSMKSGYDDWLKSASGDIKIFLSPFLAGRYRITPKIAACLKAYFSIAAGWSGLGGVLGVTIRLK